MSYCRFSKDSDVYMYAHYQGGIDCCACRLEGRSVRLSDVVDALEHLQQHVDAGHKVPSYAVDQLAEEPIEAKP